MKLACMYCSIYVNGEEKQCLTFTNMNAESVFTPNTEGRKEEERACREKIGRSWQVISANRKRNIFHYLCTA